MLPTAFTKTMVTMNARRPGMALLRLAAAVLCFGGMGYWALRVPVTLYETTPEARLEISSNAAVVQAPITGRVVQTTLALGKQVKAGDVLVRLDALPEELQAKAEETRLTAIGPEIAALEAQIRAERSAGEVERLATLSAIEEARLKIRELESPAELAKIERARMERLKREGLAPERDYQKAISDFERAERSTATARAAIERLEREQKNRDEERSVRIAAIQTQITRLDQGRANVAATIRRVNYDAERRVIRAPVDGTIGEAAVLRDGSVLTEGARVAAIIPAGQLRVVAQFSPQAAYGRLRQGSPARLRLKGYPWTEFGVLEAQVAQVAGEDRDGRVRVELDVLPSPTLRVTPRHGMPGELEVEVDQTPPFALIMRTAGQWLTARAGA